MSPSKIALEKPPSDEGGEFCRRQKTEGENPSNAENANLSLPQSATPTAPSSEGAKEQKFTLYEYFTTAR